MLFPRMLSRAGMQLEARDLAAGVRSLGGHADFAAAFARWLPAADAWAISTGRAALTQILQALANGSHRREVIVQAYTCPTVPLAAARAGLTVRLIDVERATGNMAPATLRSAITGDTLAVIAVHMHGLPCDLPAIAGIAHAAGAYVVEDCAQAGGASLAGKRVGTLGDAAFFSLGRGKGLTTYEGGIGCTADSNLAPRLHPDRLPPPPFGREALTTAKLLAMTALLHPRLYGFVRALPLGWDNENEPQFPITGMGRFRLGVALSELERLDSLLPGFREHAAYYRKHLSGRSDLQLFAELPSACPSYPWFPALVPDAPTVVRRLQSLGVTRLFPYPLNGYPYLQEIVPHERQAEAEYVADHLVTLPTHGYVTRHDMDRIIDVLCEVS